MVVNTSRFNIIYISVNGLSVDAGSCWIQNLCLIVLALFILLEISNYLIAVKNVVFQSNPLFDPKMYLFKMYLLKMKFG